MKKLLFVLVPLCWRSTTLHAQVVLKKNVLSVVIDTIRSEKETVLNFYYSPTQYEKAEQIQRNHNKQESFYINGHIFTEKILVTEGNSSFKDASLVLGNVDMRNKKNIVTRMTIYLE